MALHTFLSLMLLAYCAASAAQSVKPKDLVKGGADSLPQLQELLKGPDLDTRVEAVKAIVEIGGPRSVDALIQATRDNDPEVQIRATDGLVNVYLPGYVRTGLGASLKRVGTNIKSKFSDTNDQVIDSYVTVRPDAVEALGKLVRGAARMDVRANAARAVGVLRGAQAVPELLEAVRSKDTGAIYESLIALQKIRDQSAAPAISFLLHDLNAKVQLAAIETTGLLQNKASLPELQDVLKRAKDSKIRRAALAAIAMLPDDKNRELYERYLGDKDDRLRGAAAEGYGRLKNPADLPKLESAYEEERKTSPRLSLAFALATLGKTEMAEFSPLQYLVNTLNSSAYRGEAFAFLVELARDPAVRTALYTPLSQGTKEEKINLARVMARSGGQDTTPQLERLSHDPNREVAEEGLRALRSLQARL